MAYDFGFYISGPGLEDVTGVPSVACFLPISEDEMCILGKRKPSADTYSFLTVTEFQGYRANDTDIYEDILIDHSI